MGGREPSSMVSKMVRIPAINVIEGAVVTILLLTDRHYSDMLER